LVFALQVETAGGGPYPVGPYLVISGQDGPRAPSSWDQDRPGARRGGPPPRQPFCFNYAENFVILRDPYCGYMEMT
jgi:hypothetical protein